MEAGKKVRADINLLVDEDSFVELSCYSFSANELYDRNAEGEGVVTGFATVCDYSFFIVAQNAEVLSGGVSKANCEKIEKCLAQAEKASAPVIWMLSSAGVRVGEGIGVLEGLAEILLKASRLKGAVPQFLIVNGEVYGQISALAGICDFTYFIDKKSVLAANSPLVISAKGGVNLNKFDVGGAKALCHANLATFTVDGLGSVRESIAKLAELISVPSTEYGKANEIFDGPIKFADVNAVLNIFDEGSAVELGKSYSPEARCFIARVGGYAVAAVVFDGKDGVELTASNVRKIRDFAEFAGSYGLPYVNFVNTLGIKADPEVNDSLVLKEIGGLVAVLDGTVTSKISVVYGKAIGLGYTLFAAKSMGYDYSYAYADAKIALFDSLQGAEIEFAGDKKADKAKLAEKYADENSDPFNAAEGGYIDNIIRPAFAKQYLIASLQMLSK